MTTRILVLEPNRGLRDTLRACLHKYRIEMSALRDPSSLLAHVGKEMPSAIVLRADRPFDDVYVALRKLRAAGYEMPVIMLSRDANIAEKIDALELGADDYLIDPFYPMELVARIKCVLRRYAAYVQELPAARETCRFGDLEVDFVTRCARRNGCDIGLRASEFALLEAFVLRPMRVLSRANLLALLGKDALEQSERGLDVRVFRLRSVIQRGARPHRYIRTVRGRGYMFVPPVTAPASDAHGLWDECAPTPARFPGR
ncbi:DNA-binding response regulator [Burkholderia sp. Bp9017]|uniref:winged helix-turn-helix domain-containing protein n=1 Tax=Burkholderia TaxID=32008 RepID=UPI000F5DFB18|nr:MULTISPECIES: response regulator transcription factor [Burkholderia]MBY4868822.1 response regulator transcription factor [Burkholderia anthina]RQZ20474.1 DNA-binding response regulator [Burkholderia sp. Bp9017]